MAQKNKPFDPKRTRELQDMYQNYGRGGVIMALVMGLIVIGAFVYRYLF